MQCWLRSNFRQSIWCRHTKAKAFRETFKECTKKTSENKKISLPTNIPSQVYRDKNKIRQDAISERNCFKLHLRNWFPNEDTSSLDSSTKLDFCFSSWLGHFNFDQSLLYKMTFLVNSLSLNSFNGIYLWFIYCRAFRWIKRANPLKGHTGININITYQSRLPEWLSLLLFA